LKPTRLFEEHEDLVIRIDFLHDADAERRMDDLIPDRIGIAGGEVMLRTGSLEDALGVGG
jgi:hypothetical protein